MLSATLWPFCLGWHFFCMCSNLTLTTLCIESFSRSLCCYSLYVPIHPSLSDGCYLIYFPGNTKIHKKIKSWQNGDQIHVLMMRFSTFLPSTDAVGVLDDSRVPLYVLFLPQSWCMHYPAMDLLPDTKNCGLCMRRECRECFPRHCGLAIPTCITARASRTCRDVCRDR